MGWGSTGRRVGSGSAWHACRWRGVPGTSSWGRKAGDMAPIVHNARRTAGAPRSSHGAYLERREELRQEFGVLRGVDDLDALSQVHRHLRRPWPWVGPKRAIRHGETASDARGGRSWGGGAGGSAAARQPAQHAAARGGGGDHMAVGGVAMHGGGLSRAVEAEAAVAVAGYLEALAQGRLGQLLRRYFEIHHHAAGWLPWALRPRSSRLHRGRFTMAYERHQPGPPATKDPFARSRQIAISIVLDRDSRNITDPS